MELECIPPFVYKTYQLVSDKSTDHIVTWSPYGTSLLIRNMELFEGVILPQYFKHSNFSSFVRQLNIYDFHKITNTKSSALEYSHHLFQRDSPEKLKGIQRKKPGSKKKTKNKTRKIVPYVPSSVPVPTKEEIDNFSTPISPLTTVSPMGAPYHPQYFPNTEKCTNTRTPQTDNYTQLQNLLTELFEHQRKTEETIYALCTEWMQPNPNSRP